MCYGRQVDFDLTLHKSSRVANSRKLMDDKVFKPSRQQPSTRCLEQRVQQSSSRSFIFYWIFGI
jgi:hypothetical protein